VKNSYGEKDRVDEAITDDVSKDVKSIRKAVFMLYQTIVYLIFTVAINSNIIDVSFEKFSYYRNITWWISCLVFT
jgi:hypothetical protein